VVVVVVLGCIVDAILFHSQLLVAVTLASGVLSAFAIEGESPMTIAPPMEAMN